jgi:hypothetical protein
LIALAQRQRWQSKQTTSGSASDAQTPPPTSDESDASSKKASIFKVCPLHVSPPFSSQMSNPTPRFIFSRSPAHGHR